MSYGYVKIGNNQIIFCCILVLLLCTVMYDVTCCLVGFIHKMHSHIYKITYFCNLNTLKYKPTIVLSTNNDLLYLPMRLGAIYYGNSSKHIYVLLKITSEYTMNNA